jgi:hypothetical protein
MRRRKLLCKKALRMMTNDECRKKVEKAGKNCVPSTKMMVSSWVSKVNRNRRGYCRHFPSNGPHGRRADTDAQMLKNRDSTDRHENGDLSRGAPKISVSKLALQYSERGSTRPPYGA